MSKPPKIDHAKLLGAESPEELLLRVKRWSSSLSDDQSAIRSAILSLHGSLEGTLKRILLIHLARLICCAVIDDDSPQASGVRRKEPRVQVDEETARKNLGEVVDRMSFWNVYSLLKPALDNYGHPELLPLGEINKLRNAVAHDDETGVKFRNREIYHDHQALAEFYAVCWAALRTLDDFEDDVMNQQIGMEALGWEVAAGKYVKRGTGNETKSDEPE